MPGPWHIEMQSLFEESSREVAFQVTEMREGNATKRMRRADVCTGGTVIEFQSCRIERQEVEGRNSDYEEQTGKGVIWVIDCTETNAIRLVEGDDVWLLVFEKQWQVDSMKDCKILFADFGDDEHGGRIFRVPVKSVRHRFVKVCGSWTDRVKWKEHVTSAELQTDDVECPPQSTLTVAQDPHGSGKTYNLTRMMIRTDLPEYEEYNQYSTFIVVTKVHAAKQVVLAEFRKHLKAEDCTITMDLPHGRQHTIAFTNPYGQETECTTCIFGTMDSLMYSLCDNKVHGQDMFINLVKTIHKYGPTKTQGPKGNFRYAGQYPAVNKKTLIVVDEATMMEEIYADALATLMSTCSVDVHLAGDVQQSTFYERNMLTRVISEFNTNPQSLPSFPDCNVKVTIGNEVRRFSQTAVDSRNMIMRRFHDDASHNLEIPKPVAASGVTHRVNGKHVIRVIERTGNYSDPDSDEIRISADTIMADIEEHVMMFILLPNHIIIICPYVKNNPLMDELQARLHEFWSKKFYDDDYVKLVNSRLPEETDESRQKRIDEYNEIKSHISDLAANSGSNHASRLSWFCVLHRSEQGRPIDTSQSTYATRMTSIHASQGDGRRFAYVVQLSEQKLASFTNGNVKSLVYESLCNVAISRFSEHCYIYLENHPDDIWKRCKDLIDEETSKPPTFDPKNTFSLIEVASAVIDEGLYNRVKNKICEASSNQSVYNHRNPLVDHGHHVVRMATAEMMFYMHIAINQAKNAEHSEQLVTVLRKASRARIESFESKRYYNTLRKTKSPDTDEERVIPVLDYKYGSESFIQEHGRIIGIIKAVQEHIGEWLSGRNTNVKQLTPLHAVLLQYAVEIFTCNKMTIRMDQIYDIARDYTHSSGTPGHLQQHYDYINNMTIMYTHVVNTIGDENQQWKISRSVKLGNKLGGETQYFKFYMSIRHLVVTETQAIPVILIADDIQEMNMCDVCAQALLYTLVCLQPEKGLKQHGRGTPTWELLQNKEQIRICFVPLKGTQPVVVDVTDIVKENMKVIADWICNFTKHANEEYMQQVRDVAEYYGDDYFDEARDTIHDCLDDLCPLYISEAMNAADDCATLDTQMKNILDVHLRAFKRDLWSSQKKKKKPSGKGKPDHRAN